MTQDELKKELQRMMQKCPQCLTPGKIRRYTLLGKNRIYNLIHSGEIPAFIYQGTYVINKDDVIEYLLKHSEDAGRGFKACENVNPGTVEPTEYFGEKVSGENHFLKGSLLTDGSRSLYRYSKSFRIYLHRQRRKANHSSRCSSISFRKNTRLGGSQARR